MSTEAAAAILRRIAAADYQCTRPQMHMPMQDDARKALEELRKETPVDLLRALADRLSKAEAVFGPGRWVAWNRHEGMGEREDEKPADVPHWNVLFEGFGFVAGVRRSEMVEIMGLQLGEAIAEARNLVGAAIEAAARNPGWEDRLRTALAEPAA